MVFLPATAGAATRDASLAGRGVAAGNSRGTQPMTGSSSMPTWAAAGLLLSRTHSSAAAVAPAHRPLRAGMAARRGCRGLAIKLQAPQTLLGAHQRRWLLQSAPCG